MVALYVNNNNNNNNNNNSVTYFDSFGVKHIAKEIKAFSDSKNIKTNTLKIQAFDSIMCKYFCTGVLNFMLAGKTLTEFTNLFSPNNSKKYDDMILNYFMTDVIKWLNAIPLSMIFMKHQTCIQI